MTQMISKTQVPVKRAGRIDPIAFFERFGVLIFMMEVLQPVADSNPAPEFAVSTFNGVHLRPCETTRVTLMLP